MLGLDLDLNIQVIPQTKENARTRSRSKSDAHRPPSRHIKINKSLDHCILALLLFFAFSQPRVNSSIITINKK